ncbi:MAG TPA: hypothetical protein VFF43_09650, partial [Caldimonas sp.]|nr:hypothetical protein [Caldimonas sp.]
TTTAELTYSQAGAVLRGLDELREQRAQHEREQAELREMTGDQGGPADDDDGQGDEPDEQDGDGDATADADPG